MTLIQPELVDLFLKDFLFRTDGRYPRYDTDLISITVAELRLLLKEFTVLQEKTAKTWQKAFQDHLELCNRPIFIQKDCEGVQMRMSTEDANATS